MTQGELEKIPLPFQRHMSDLENRIMADLVERLKANREITSTADWQINRLKQLGLSNSYIKQQIKEAAGLNDAEIDKLYGDTAKESYIRNRDLYQKIGKDITPFEKNRELQELLAAVKEQTAEQMHNITGSLGFAIRGPDGNIMHSPLKKFYQDTLDAAMFDMATGTFDYDTVLNRTIQTMTNSGLRSIDYDSGRSYRVDTAARMCISTGFNQLQAKINEQVAKDLKTDYFEVSWHGGARPSHQVWQGRVYSKSELGSVCGLGSPGGLCGVHCYHSYNAFIPGVSTRVYTDAQLDRMNRDENAPKTYKGKEYTTYEALQEQRKMERLMRKQRQDIRLTKKGDADALALQAKYRGTMDEYVKFSKKMKLPEQRDRIFQDGLGNMSGKTNLPEPKAGGIIKKKTKVSTPQVKYWDAAKYKQLYKSKKEASDALMQMGIKFVDSKKYPMDETLLCDCVSWLSEFTKTFKEFDHKNPCRLPTIQCMAPSKMHNSVGYYSYYNSTLVKELALNGQYHSDINVFQQYVDRCIKTKWYPQNATVHKTFVHEYGHHVSNSMRWIEENPQFQHEFIKECITDYNSQMKTQYKSYKELTDMVSSYGASSESELFAEAFAEYFGGENPREFATIFGRKLEAKLRGVK